MISDNERALAALSALINCTAKIVDGNFLVSPYQEDHIVKVPATTLRQINKQNERLCSLAGIMQDSIETIRTALQRDDSVVDEMARALEQAIKELNEYAIAEHREEYNNPKFNEILSKFKASLGK